MTSVRTDYALLKYSRSYPNGDAALMFNIHPTAFDSEWQHFSHPNLLLFLEETNPAGSFISAKEDIDLLAFPPVSTALMKGTKAQNQSLPLKVVYRDSVVGFRYLHPCVIAANSLPTYRRFQISFANPEKAMQFVNSIRQICPCKASPPPTVISALKPIPVPFGHLVPSQLQNSGSSLHPQNQFSNVILPTTSSHLPATAVEQRATRSGSSVASDCSLLVPGVTPDTKSSYQSSACFTPQVPYKHASGPLEGLRPPDRNTNNVLRRPLLSCDVSDGLSYASKVSTPHPVESNILVERTGNDPARVTSATRSGDPENGYRCCDLMHSLNGLHAMTNSQLEQLVAEVIREPGFLSLLEKFDQMWQVKSSLAALRNA
ncbi:hypothetical protein K439DRAFT_771924 [Ramaria rubella]|nr:hypothetical protein K439DRAFT_771924 [Ramaria rubella]